MSVSIVVSEAVRTTNPEGGALLAASFVLFIREDAEPFEGQNLEWPYTLTPEEVAGHSDGDIDDLIKRETVRGLVEFRKFAYGDPVVADARDLIGATITEDQGVAAIDKSRVIAKTGGHTRKERDEAEALAAAEIAAVEAVKP